MPELLGSAGLPLFVAALAAIGASGVLVTLAWPAIAQPDPLARRIAAIERQLRAAMPDGSGREDSAAAQRRSVREVLSEVDEVRRARNRRILIRRLREAGLDWSKRRYHALVAGLGIAGVSLGQIFALGPLMAVALGIVLALGVPNLLLSALRKRRIRLISTEFPNAIDVIVRGVRSGLPLPDCLRTIAQEAREPLRGEFARLVGDVNAGLPIGDAVQRLAERLPINEANFFAIVVAIQSRTGGNLTGSLQNLSNVLRERQKMRAKVASYSSEAKVSAMIIGALPIVVGSIVYVTSPDYIGVLFTDTYGKIVLAACGIWMTIGVLVMRKMIDFDF